MTTCYPAIMLSASLLLVSIGGGHSAHMDLIRKLLPGTYHIHSFFYLPCQMPWGSFILLQQSNKSNVNTYTNTTWKEHTVTSSGRGSCEWSVKPAVMVEPVNIVVVLRLKFCKEKFKKRLNLWVEEGKHFLQMQGEGRGKKLIVRQGS